MFPNEVMTQQQTWNDILAAMVSVQRAHGWNEVVAIKFFIRSTKNIIMANKKELRIGLIGCGFMGRTHSNGYNRIRNFFPELAYRAGIKSCLFPKRRKSKGFC